MVEISGTGLSRMIPPIPVPADGTQTKCSDFAIQRDKEKPVPSQGNPPSTPPPDPRAQPGPRSAHWDPPPQDVLGHGSMTLSCPGGVSGPVKGGGRADRSALRTQGHQGPLRRGASEVGRRTLAWQNHFRSGEVILGRGTCRGKGPGVGCRQLREMGKIQVEDNRKLC